MKFKLLIFDLDGVLVDSTEAITNTFNHVLMEVDGISAGKKEITGMIGMPLEKMFERYIPGKGKECSEAYRKIYRKTCVHETRLYSDVNEVLAYLKTKAVLAVATTKYSREARILMKGLGIIRYFDFVLGADSVHKPKPEPDVILKILDLAGSRKDRTVFVGDTTYDILAGKAAGVTTIAVTYGFQKKDILTAAKPDFLIDSLPELRNIVR